MTFGERLTYFREKRGWTKTYVANKLGIKTMSTYANWEYDLREPDREMLEKLADLYEVSLDELVGREIETDNKEFENFIKDPELRRWFKELPKSEEEDLARLKRIWEAYKEE